MIRSSIRKVRRRLTPRLRSGNVILVYHRIAGSPVDPWALCVSAENFTEQMRVLGSIATPIELARIRTAAKRPGVAVTFDDGYCDNLHSAKPILEEFGIPATVFVSTGFLGAPRGFWWDELENAFLYPGTLPGTDLVLGIDGKPRRWSIEPADLSYSAADCDRHRGWVAWRDHPPTSRHLVFHSVWETLRQLEPATRKAALDQIIAWAGSAGTYHGGTPMTEQEVRQLAAGELIGIGAHTITHPRLSALPPDGQRAELQESKNRLEELLGRPVTTFSYPFGSLNDYTHQTIRAVREIGFKCACSNFEGKVRRGTSAFELPRLHVHNWNGAEFRDWLTAFLAARC